MLCFLIFQLEITLSLKRELDFELLNCVQSVKHCEELTKKLIILNYLFLSQNAYSFNMQGPTEQALQYLVRFQYSNYLIIPLVYSGVLPARYASTMVAQRLWE